ncbi:MAG: hypothetical protein JKY27_04385, partial [Magnetovibrio sp.]|nr:hypothetical protein [Magnetovibrio sp.]
MLKKILIRVDADCNIGLAHIVRIHALIKAMGEPYELFLWGRGVNIQNYFPAVQVFETGDGLLDGMKDILEKVNPDLLITDHPHLSADHWSQLSGAALCPVICIDDEGGPVIADLILNGTVLPAYHHYPALPSDGMVLSGG